MMKRCYLSAILLLVLLLAAGSYVLLRSSGDLARAAPPPRPLSDAPWWANVRVNDDGEAAPQVQPSIAVDGNGNGYAVWDDERNGNSDVYFSYRPSGGTWGTNVRVNDARAGSRGYPSVAVDAGGNAYAVWDDGRNGILVANWDIYFCYRPFGGTWGTNVRVDDDAGAAYQRWPSIAVDAGGNTYAVWTDERNGNYDIYFSYRSSGGTWGTNVRVNDDAGFAQQSGTSIAVDASGNAYAVWGDCRNGNSDVYFSYRSSGGTWGTNVRVNDDAGAAYKFYPYIAVDAGGNTYAVWTDERNGPGSNNWDIYFSYRPAGGGPTPTPTPIPTCERGLVVLVHGRGGDASSFGDLEQWLSEDGFCVGAVNGITPAKTLDDNARDILMPQIDQIRNYLGYGPEDDVVIIAHSLGGLVSRAYVESDLYRGDVQRIFLLGSPNGGVDPGVLGFLLNILGPWCRLVNPADCEISQPGMVLFNLMHRPNISVAYYLIAGNAGELHPLSLLTPLKPDDRAVTVESVHAIGGSTVWKYERPDCHSNTWVGDPLWQCPSAYFLPRATYDACIRPRLIGQPVTGCTEVPGISVGVTSATASNVATTPFITDVITTTQTVTHTITIDNAGDTHFYLIWSEGDLDLTLTDPANNFIDPAVAGTDPDIEFLSVPAAEIPTNMEIYSIANAAAGEWQVHVTGVDTGGQQVSLLVFALLETPLSFTVATDSDWYPQGGTVEVTASLRDVTSAVSGATVEAEFVRPDGEASTLALYDDGLHNDGAAGDGIYGNTYTDASVGGYYSVNASAVGIYNSVAFERGAETVFTVSTNAASLTGAYNDYPEDVDSDGKFESLVLEVGVNVNQDGDYALAATLEDGIGQLIDQTVKYETLSTGIHSVLVRFDGQAILDHNVDGPYTISQVVLSDITGASVLLEEAHDVHTTAAYDHNIFGNDWLIYLPLITKTY